MQNVFAMRPEVRARRADGTEGWILGRGQRVIDADGAPWLHGAAIDVTDRHQAEELRRNFETEDARRAELDAARGRIVEAAQEERRRLERNLHDGAQQRLVSLSLQLGLLEARLKLDPEASEALDQVRRQLAESLEELRDLARGIHPAIVTQCGLAVALESVAARAPVPVEVDVQLESRPPERGAVAACYVVSESLTNVAKYARASCARVAVSRSPAELVVEIRDDGIGGANAAGGSGLRGLADRVDALGGQLRVWSPAGEGTRIRAEIPCA